MSISLILPCYNEIHSIERLQNSLEVMRATYPELQVETIVVNDGSKDGTAEALETAGFDKIVHHKRNLGYGAAIKTGLHHAQGDWVAFMDFDGTCNPSDLHRLLKHSLEKNSDMTFGYRLHRESHMPKTRRVGNRLYAMALRTLFPMKFLLSRNPLPKDVCTGFRLMKKDIAKELFVRLPNDLSFSPALTAIAVRRGLNLQQVSIEYAEREGQSKLSVFKDGFRFLFTLIRFSA